jgi:hypothetical protein
MLIEQVLYSFYWTSRQVNDKRYLKYCSEEVMYPFVLCSALLTVNPRALCLAEGGNQFQRDMCRYDVLE